MFAVQVRFLLTEGPCQPLKDIDQMENPGNQLKTGLGILETKLNAIIIFLFVSCHEQKLIFQDFLEDKFVLIAFLFMCVYVCRCTCTSLRLWRAEDDFQKLILSLHQVEELRSPGGASSTFIC